MTFSLGYLVGDWISDSLPSLTDPSQPFVLTREQARFLVAWYLLDESGDFVYRRGLLEQPKGWGKSPLAGTIALAEFAGPTRYAGKDAEGQPVGKPWGREGAPPAWVQVAASSADQANSNVYSLIWEFLSLNGGKAAEALGIDEGRTRLFLKDSPGAKLEAVTSEAGSREGQRVTFGVLDETHLWTPRNRGTALARTLRRNAAKSRGRCLECANAPEVGAQSIAEETAEAAKTGGPGILHVANRPSIDPTADMADKDLLDLLAEVYGEAKWVDPQRILQEVRDPAVPWEEAARYFLNVPGAATSAAIDPATWESLTALQEVEEGTAIAAGFDGSLSQGATALVGCTEGGHLFPLLVIERPKDAPEGWTIPRNRVREAVASMFEKYDVQAFYCDPYHWRAEIDDWADEHGEEIVLEVATNSRRRFGPMVERFRVAAEEGNLHHPDDGILSRHVLNARLRAAGKAQDDGHELYLLEKAGPGRFISAGVAAVLAYEAAQHISEMTDYSKFVL